MDRRSLMLRVVPGLVLGGVGTGLSSSAIAVPKPGQTQSAGEAASCDASIPKFESYEELEKAFDELGELPEEQVVKYARQATGELPTPKIPLPGPAALVQCALASAWIFRNGTTKNTVMMQLADAVMSCVGIPLGSAVVIKVARLIWKYKGKIIAALSAAGLTAAQLAPLKNAPKP